MILTDHPNPTLCLLDYSHESPTLSSIASLNLHENHARPTLSFSGILVTKIQADNIAIVSAYIGRLKVVKIKDNGFDTGYETDLS